MEVLRTFDQECLNAADNARRTLITILQDNADTEYPTHGARGCRAVPRHTAHAGQNSSVLPRLFRD